MKSFDLLYRSFHHFHNSIGTRIQCLRKSFGNGMSCLYRFLAAQLNPFRIHLCYSVFVCLLGFLVLRCLPPKTNSGRPKDIDLFFTSVASVTLSSMSSVEMEVFSNAQLVFMTILILLGGEVFLSILGLHFVKSKFNAAGRHSSPSKLGEGTVADLEDEGPNSLQKEGDIHLKHRSVRLLCYVASGYLFVFLIGGSIILTIYLGVIPSARRVLEKKGLQIDTFAVFTAISTFSNCGFLPTNESMMVFKNNSGLLLYLIVLTLVGNTLYPSCLRFLIWLLGRLTRRDEFEYMLNNTEEMGYPHLLPSRESLYLMITMVGFILVQFILFGSFEWNSGALDGMSWYQKTVGVLFQAVNTRHTGESIVDMSIISPAVLALTVVMMYLPSYILFMPKVNKKRHLITQENKKERKRIPKSMFSQLTYLSIFVILVCITERKRLKEDPLNFTVFNIIFEVISAYGNVGFTTGYSCKRQINPSEECKDMWYGFSGRWSNQGKVVLIVVMFFGRLKKFNRGGGKAWKLM